MTAEKPWAVHALDEADEVHVVPVLDAVGHDLTDECLCGPSLEIVVNEDAPDGHVYTHHSLDGREARE